MHPDTRELYRQLGRRHRRVRQRPALEAARQSRYVESRRYGLHWLTRRRRSHSSCRQEAAQLRPGNRQQRVHQRSEQSTARRCAARRGRADGEEVAAARRQRRQVRRQRLRPHQQGRRAHWLESQRRRGGGAEAEAVVEDSVVGPDARVGWENCCIFRSMECIFMHGLLHCTSCNIIMRLGFLSLRHKHAAG
jgi:hypothetical protein